MTQIDEEVARALREMYDDGFIELEEIEVDGKIGPARPLIFRGSDLLAKS
jgi:hypothetical protein